MCVVCALAAGCGGGKAAIMLQVMEANASPQCTGSGAAFTCTVDEGQSLPFVATLANDTKMQGVTWTLTGTACAGNGCGMLTNVTTSSVTYTAPTPIGASLTATLEAQANANSGATVKITLIIEPPPIFPTPAQVLPNGLNGIPYSQTITASGGVAPLFFSVMPGSGNLPAGLTLNSTGTIVGLPSGSGTSTFTVQAKDSGTPLTATQVFSFSISAAPKLSIGTTSLPNATVGIAYSMTVAPQGGVPPITWSIVAGQGTGLPPGFTLNTTNGLISGTTTTAGLYTFMVQAQDSTLPTNQTAQRALAINVESVNPLTINTAALGSGTTGSAYTANLQATGGVPPYTWTVASGLLPSGLTLDPNTGTISGTPIVAATSKFAVVASDSQSPTPNTTPPEPLSIMIGPGTATADLELVSGTYSFLFNGFDCQGYVSMAGAFASSGTGTIAAGIEDSNRFSGVALGVALTGTYTVGSDGRGTMQLIATDSLGRMLTSNYLLTLESDGSARFIESDLTATLNPNCPAGTDFTHGAGIMKPQTNTSLAAANFSGHYSFGFAGQDLAGNPAALVGTVFADGSGLITTGPGPGTSMLDFNDGGLFGSQLTVSGTFATSGTFDRGTTSLTFPNPNSSQTQLTLGYAFYFVSDSDLFFVSIDTTDATHPRTSGEMLRQSATTVFDKTALLGTSVASGSGTATGSLAKSFAGLLTAAQLPAGFSATLAFDQNSGGIITSPPSAGSSVTGAYTVLPNGRADLSSLGGPFSVVYLTGQSQGFLMGSDATVVAGVLEQQNPGPAFTNAEGQAAFTNAAVQGGYAISAQAATDDAVLNIVGQATSSGTGTIGGTLDEAGPTGSAGSFGGQTLTAAYNVSSDGRGQMSVLGPPAGLPPSLAFYLLSQAKFRAVSIEPGDQHPTIVFFDH